MHVRRIDRPAHRPDPERIFHRREQTKQLGHLKLALKSTDALPFLVPAASPREHPTLVWRNHSSSPQFESLIQHAAPFSAMVELDHRADYTNRDFQIVDLLRMGARFLRDSKK